MARVEIWDYTNIPGEVIATVEMDNGNVRIITEHPGLRADLAEGIVGRGGQKYTLEDGDNFIYELPYAITGSFIRAKLV